MDRDTMALDTLEREGTPITSAVMGYSSYYNSKTTRYPYDLKEAGRILDQAGYVFDPKTRMRMDPGTSKVMRAISILTPAEGL